MKKRLPSTPFLLAAAFTATMSFSAFTAAANTTTSAANTNENTISLAFSAYDELAENGIISKETVTKMNAFADAHIETETAEYNVSVNTDNDTENVATQIFEVVVATDNMLDLMLDAGIISPAEKTTIENYYQQRAHADFEAEVDAAAARYVEEKIVSKDTAKKMVNHAKSNYNKSSQYGIYTGVSIVSDKAVDTETESNSAGESDTESTTFTFSASIFDLDDLLSQGIITEAEKQAIEKAEETTGYVTVDVSVNMD